MKQNKNGMKTELKIFILKSFIFIIINVKLNFIYTKLIMKNVIFLIKYLYITLKLKIKKKHSK